MYTDLTGAFPVHSFQNIKYIFVAYIYDINAVIVRPMPNRNEQSFITAFTDIFTVLKAQNYHPTLNAWTTNARRPWKNTSATTK
jgi:hypothetical protein